MILLWISEKGYACVFQAGRGIIGEVHGLRDVRVLVAGSKCFWIVVSLLVLVGLGGRRSLGQSNIFVGVGIGGGEIALNPRTGTAVLA